MKKDIHLGEVKNISIAIVPENLGSGEPEWVVYFLNLKDEAVDSVLINAEGRGMISGEERHTATMRFFLERVEARSYKKLEMILPEAFALNNQYWVSFYIDNHIFDKKYIFAANSINQDRLVIVPLLERPGVVVN